jgi:hypothetical protein
MVPSANRLTLQEPLLDGGPNRTAPGARAEDQLNFHPEITDLFGDDTSPNRFVTVDVDSGMPGIKWNGH